MLRTLFATACLFGLCAAPAAAGVLTFSGDICGGPCAVDQSFIPISNDYGDIAGQLDVSYFTLVNGAVAVSNLFYWKNNYGGLDGVAYGDIGSAEILFKPASGYAVTVTGFQLGAYLGDYLSRFTVFDGLGNVLYTSGVDPITIVGSAPSTFTGNWTSSDGIRISFGPDSFNVGIDNVTFEVTALPVPEPSQLILVATAMAGLWCFRRRPAPPEGAARPMARALG